MDLKTQKGVTLKVILIIVAVVIVIVIIGRSSNNMYHLSNSEQVAYTTLRYEISKARASNEAGTLSSKHFNLLKQMVKNADSTNQWFSSNRGLFYGNTADTSDIEVTWVSDGTYRAIFYVTRNGTAMDYFLENYVFSVDDVKGYSFFVGD